MRVSSIGSSFVPVHHPPTAAAWYADRFGVDIESSSDATAVLRVGGHRVTLMGPASGILAGPGLPWATCSFLVEDLEAARSRFEDASAMGGDPAVCLFFTAHDPDGNVVLVVDR